MEKILTYKGAVMTWETDSNGHMNVMYYINKFEHAGRNFDIELGNNETEAEEIGVVALEQNIKYHREVFEDDLIYVKSGLVSIGNKAIVIEHELYNTRKEELAATMRVVLVRFDKVNRKSMPFPADRRIALLKKWGLEA